LRLVKATVAVAGEFGDGRERGEEGGNTDTPHPHTSKPQQPSKPNFQPTQHPAPSNWCTCTPTPNPNPNPNPHPHPHPPPRTLKLVHLYPSPAIIWCSRAASALVRVKMMVWPSFSQLGKICSCSTLVLSTGLGQLRARLWGGWKGCIEDGRGLS